MQGEAAMAHEVFFRARPFGERRKRWQAVASIGYLILGALHTLVALQSSSLLWGVSALAWWTMAGASLWESRRAERPVVAVESDELVLGRGLRARRYALGRLAWAPDPFDATAIRLRRPDGGYVRIARDSIDGADRLEALLRGRLAASTASLDVGTGGA
jgi:hypothetical protein